LTNALLCFGVLFASIIRLTQTPRIFELIFIIHLIAGQLSFHGIYYFDEQVSKSQRDERHDPFRNSGVFTLAYSTLAVICGTTGGAAFARGDTLQALHRREPPFLDFLQQCNLLRGYPQFSGAIFPGHPLYLVSLVNVSLIFLVFTGLTFAGIACIAVKSSKVSFRVSIKIILGTLDLVCATTSACFSMWCYRRLQEYRHAMHKADRINAQDNTWGWGQVTAVLMYYYPVQKAVREAYSMLDHFPGSLSYIADKSQESCRIRDATSSSVDGLRLDRWMFKPLRSAMSISTRRSMKI